MQKELFWFLLVVSLSTLIIVSSLRGCAKINEEAEGRRLAEKWEALTVAKEIKKQGSTNEQWPASVFLSLDLLNRCASVLKGTTVVYLPDKPIIKGAAVTITKIEVRSEVGQLVANIEVEAYSQDRKTHLKMGADATVLYVGTELDEDKKGTAIFRLDPYSFYGEGGYIVPLFKIGETSDFARLLANTALLHIDETELKFSVPVPTDFTIPLGGQRTLEEKLGESSVEIAVSEPKETITTPLEFGSFMVCKSGFFLLADHFKHTLDPVEKPLAPATVPDEMKPVYEHLQRIGSPLWKSELPKTQDALKAILAKLEAELAEMFAQKPAEAGDVVLFLKGDTLTGLIAQFHANAASREATAQSTSVAGRLAEKKWRDDTFGNGGIFAELKGNDAIAGKITVDIVGARWSASGFKADLSYSLNATAKTDIQFDPLIAPKVEADIDFSGTSDGPQIPISILPTIIAKGEAKAAAFEVTLFDEGITTGVTAKKQPSFPGDWLSLPSLALKMHGSLMGEQPAPYIALDNESRVIAPNLKDSKKWKVALPFGYAVLTPTPTRCLPTDKGLVVASDLKFVLRKATATSPEGLAEDSQIKQRNEAIKSALKDAGIESAKKRTRAHPRTFEVAFGNALIDGNSDLGKALGDAQRAGQKILGKQAKIVVPQLVKAQEEKAKAKKVLDDATRAADDAKDKAIKAAKDVNDTAVNAAQKILNAALATLPPVPPVIKAFGVEEPASKIAHDAAQRVRDAAEKAARGSFNTAADAAKTAFNTSVDAANKVHEVSLKAAKASLEVAEKAEATSLAALNEQFEIGSTVTVMP